MIIGIDGNEANVKERVGINVYAFEIIWGLYNLVKNSRKKCRLIVYLKSGARDDLPKEDKHISYKVLHGGKLWILTKLTPHLSFVRSERLDVFFTPSHYLPALVGVPLVFSVMDLGYLEFSGQFRKRDYWQLKIWTAISIYISKYIITISESTMNDIVRHYPKASNKVRVTLLAYDRYLYNTDISQKVVRRATKKYLIVGDYLLFMGTLKPSKNIEGLLDAWSKVRQEHKGSKLVIAGKKGWLFDEIFKKVEKLDIDGSVIFTDFVPEKDKRYLIKGAKALILPSFWEGFGLDPLYAMAVGTPVIVSKVASIPQVVGDAGIYFNPYDKNDIADSIKKLLSMSQLSYNKLVAKGLAQADKFSWLKTANETFKVLEAASQK